MDNLIYSSNANFSSQTAPSQAFGPNCGETWNLLPVFGEEIRQLNASWFDLSAGTRKAPAASPSVKAGQAVTLASCESV